MMRFSSSKMRYGVVGMAACAAYVFLPATIQAVVYPGVAVGAGICAVQRARNESRHRLTWWLFAGAMFAFALADSLYELVSHPFPGPADFVYLFGYLLAIGGALAWRDRYHSRLMERSTDAAMVATVAGLLIWVLWLHPVVHRSEASLSSQLIALSYPVLDLALIAAISGGGRVRGARLWFAGGLTLFMVADIYYGRAVLLHTYQPGKWIDLLWMGAYVAWGLAALDRRETRQRAGAAPSRRTRRLLLASMATAPLMLGYQFLVYESLHFEEVVLAGMLIGPLAMWRLELAQRDLESALEERTQSIESLRRSAQSERAAKEATEQLRQRHQSILDAVGEGIVGVDAHGVGTFANPAAAAMLGCSLEDIIGAEVHRKVHHTHIDGSPYPSDECPIRRVAETGDGCKVDYDFFWRADGSSFPVSYAASALRDAGEITGVVVSFQDTSERIVLEEQLRHAQKMEALGVLAGGVAHDFNNLLFVVKTSASFLTETVSNDDEAREDVEAIMVAAERASELVKKLLTFSRKQVAQPAQVDLRQVVDSADALLKRALHRDIQLQLEQPEDLWSIRIDPVHAEQILLNLVMNARDALSETGGNIIVRTSNVTHMDNHPSLIESLEPGRYVCLQVSDDGAGISPQVLSRIFEPFFTTKGSSGTGLGLSTIYGIAKEAGGAISVDSTPDIGTTFRVYIPACSDPQLEAEASLGARPRLGQGELVLVADDEPNVRSLVERMLREAGYEVVTAESAADAQRVARDHSAIDLVITDVVMPGGSGLDLAEAIREKHADIPFLFMSGYADQLSAKLLERNAEHFIQKPFDANALYLKLNEVLGSASPSTEEVKTEEAPTG